MATTNVFSGAIAAVSATITGSVTAGSIAISDGKTVGGRMFASVTDSTAVVLPVTTPVGGSLFDTAYTLPAKTLNAGSMLRIRLVTRVTTLTAGTTAAIVLRLGGTAGLADGTIVGTSQAAAAGQGVGSRCVIEAVFTARADAGAAVALSGVSTAVWSGLPAVVTTYPGVGVAVPTFATNAALLIRASVTTVDNAANAGAIVVEQMIVEIV